MIEFNYSLEVDMGTEKRSYTPSEEVSRGLKNIFRLQGPNSSGKSTLMNIIALASHGLSKGKIAPSVKSRMEELVVPGYKDLEFKILIQDPVTKRTLRSTKEKGYREINVKESLDGVEDFSTIAADQFEKKYNLIYDIPENPVGRLNELTEEIKEIQKSFINMTENFQKYIEDVSKDIDGSVNPDKIKELYDQKEFEEGQLQQYSSNAEKTRVDALKRLMIALKLDDLNNKAIKTESMYNQIKKINKKTDPQTAEKAYNEKLKGLILSIQKLNKLKLQIVIDANKCKYQDFDNLKNSINCIGNDTASIMRSGGVTKSSIDEMITVQNFATSMSSSSKGEGLKAISEILAVLKPYVDKNIDLPNFGSLDEFFENFTKTFDEMNEECDFKTLDSINKNVKLALDNIQDINNIITTMDPPKKNEIDSFDKDEEISKLNQQRVSASDSRSRYVVEVSSPANIDLNNLKAAIQDLNAVFEDKYKGKSYDEIKTIYNTQEDLYKKFITDKNKIESRLTRIKIEITTAESKINSPYIEYAEYIKVLVDEVTNLRILFIEADKKLSAIEKKNYGNYKKDDPFFESVWLYLGKRLRKIRHLDKEYIASKVNLIKGMITAEDGTKIYFTDMGTGQSQLSYLKSLLSADDDRMIIALFDEVSTMTDSTLEVLFEEFEKLQKNRKLMIGMTVSPADNIEVRSYGI